MIQRFKIQREGKWVEVSEAEFKGKGRTGLGDIVAAVAQPIARAIDAVAGTKVAECGGCKKRREALNRIHL